MLKNISIQKKMVIISLVLTIIPLTFLEILCFSVIQKEIINKHISLASIYSSQIADNYQIKFDELEHQANMLSRFSPLAGYLEMEFPDRASLFSYYEENIHPMLNGYNSAYSGVRIRIYHNDPKVNVYSFELSDELDELLTQFISIDDFPVSGDFQLGNRGFWTNCDIRYNTYQPVRSYFLAVPAKDWPYDIAYVVSVHIDESFFYSQIANEPVSNALVYVLDEEGTVITSNHRQDIGKNAADFLPDVDSLQTTEAVTINGMRYLPVTKQVNGLQILYLLSFSDAQQEMMNTSLLLIFAGIALLTISSILMVRLSGRVTGGLRTLMLKMQRIDRDTIRQLAESPASTKSQDEIEQLDSVFAAMMADIDNLVETVRINEMQIKDELIARQQAELDALQRQINPHYLFNTLEAIRMNLIVNGDRKDAEIVRLFAESFRRYVDATDEMPTLFEELEFIKKYIYIQNYRMDNKIKFTVHADESVLRHRVAKLLLQPLVENAVLHGIEAKEGSGNIDIYICRRDTALHISVKDDGVGMNETELQRLQDSLRTERSGKSVGLRNVYHRLQLIYGEKADLQISSAEGCGTVITMCIPLPTETGG